jgi:hypothetical protein
MTVRRRQHPDRLKYDKAVQINRARKALAASEAAARDEVDLSQPAQAAATAPPEAGINPDQLQ